MSKIENPHYLILEVDFHLRDRCENFEVGSRPDNFTKFVSNQLNAAGDLGVDIMVILEQK